jgi:hypothetical protein
MCYAHQVDLKDSDATHLITEVHRRKSRLHEPLLIPWNSRSYGS